MGLTELEGQITGAVERLSESVVGIESTRITRDYRFGMVPVEVHDDGDLGGKAPGALDEIEILAAVRVTPGELPGWWILLKEVNPKNMSSAGKSRSYAQRLPTGELNS